VIPRRDYLDAIVTDLEWAKDRPSIDSAYCVLNACRVYAYVRDGGVYSKAEGAVLGLRALPAEFHPAIEAALAVYEDQRPAEHAVDSDDAKRLLTFILSRVREARQEELSRSTNSTE
jgi:streptomycin 3"-adenylyltransferase